MTSKSVWTAITKRGVKKPFFVIAGANVIEEDDKLLRIAHCIASVMQRVKLPFIFKASFDKANRSRLHGFRGPGLETGLESLLKVKEQVGIPILTDVHECKQVEAVSEVADIIQVPSFLCRQTDLLVAAGKSEKIVNIKKGQFASPEVMVHAVNKVKSTGNEKVMVCERGSCWGLQDIVLDPRQLVWLRNCNVPVIMDCTHACQQPTSYASPNCSSGLGNMVPVLSRAAVAVGIDGIFVECHDDPSKAPVDAHVQLPLEKLEDFLTELVDMARVLKYYQEKQHSEDW